MNARAYKIRRLSDGAWYRHQPYGPRWTDDPQKAKLYKRIGDATNAISLMVSSEETGVLPCEVHEFELSPTGKVIAFQDGR